MNPLRTFCAFLESLRFSFKSFPLVRYRSLPFSLNPWILSSFIQRQIFKHFKSLSKTTVDSLQSFRNRQTVQLYNRGQLSHEVTALIINKLTADFVLFSRNLKQSRFVWIFLCTAHPFVKLQGIKHFFLGLLQMHIDDSLRTKKNNLTKRFAVLLWNNWVLKTFG